MERIEEGMHNIRAEEEGQCADCWSWVNGACVNPARFAEVDESKKTKYPCVYWTGDASLRGKVLIGHCEDCRWWDLPTEKCPIVIMTEESGEEHMTPSDFGCVRWEAKENGR